MEEHPLQTVNKKWIVASVWYLLSLKEPGEWPPLRPPVCASGMIRIQPVTPCDTLPGDFLLRADKTLKPSRCNGHTHLTLHTLLRYVLSAAGCFVLPLTCAQVLLCAAFLSKGWVFVWSAFSCARRRDAIGHEAGFGTSQLSCTASAVLKLKIGLEVAVLTQDHLNSGFSCWKSIYSPGQLRKLEQQEWL